jgi:hypothetical protein
LSGGGAIAEFDPGTSVTISGSTFNQDTATNFASNGGAINAFFEADLTVSSSSFTNDIADRIGGAVRAKNADDVSFTSSTFSNNRVIGTKIGDESGGAIGTINTNLALTNSSFNGNASAATAAGGGVFFHLIFDDKEIYHLTVQNSSFTNNTGGLFGGGGFSISAINPLAGATASFSNSTFSNNSAAVGGGLEVDSLPTTISNSSFTNNQASTEGGGVAAINFSDTLFGATDLSSRPALAISNSSFKGNSVTGNQPPVGPFTSAQGLFDFFAGALVQLNNLLPAGVQAMPLGGGGLSDEMGGNVSVSGSSFKSNSAGTGTGGAVLVGGVQGYANGFGLTDPPMNQAYGTLSGVTCQSNSAGLYPNSGSLDPAGLGSSPNGVYLKSGGC